MTVPHTTLRCQHSTWTKQDTRWRKSSYSSGQDTCVELAHTGDGVRDSKNPVGPILQIDLAGLLAAVKSGRIG